MNSRSLLTTDRCATLALAGLSASLLLACSEPRDEGGVMVVVTTDMAVPLDIDTLLWSVTLDGETVPFKNGSFPLRSYEVLPVTLSIAAGRGTTGPITIRLAGLHGGEKGRTRVTREARLRVPADGMKELSLALDFLCTTASFPSSCAAGETCSSGECISSAVDELATLKDSRATTAASETECFETAECFNSFEAEPPLVVDRGNCLLTGSDARLAPDVNLAMVVNTAAVGAYGACGIASRQECLVPVPRGGRGGWEAILDGGEAVEIRLPPAVCRANSIDRVLLSRVRGGCPTLKAGTPLCHVPSVCVESAGICPARWGPGWVGFTCTGSADVRDIPLGRCYYRDLPSARGVSCCEKGSHERAGSQDPLLIDDMSRGPAIKLAVRPGYVPGTWWTSVDSGRSSSIDPAEDFFDYRDVAPPFTSADGKTTIERAACLRSGGFSGNLAMMGFNWLAKSGAIEPADFIDVSAYSGISFWAIAKPFAGLSGFSKDITVLFPNVHTRSYATPATCEGEGASCNDFRVSVAVTDVWTKYYVTWDDLKQKDPEKPDAPFDKRLYQTIFGSEGPGQKGTSQPFDFCISQIYFTKEESSKERAP